MTLRVANDGDVCDRRTPIKAVRVASELVVRPKRVKATSVTSEWLGTSRFTDPSEVSLTYLRPRDRQPGFPDTLPRFRAEVVAMVILTFLHAPAANLISAALSATAHVISSTTALCFATTLEREAVDVAIVDPSVDTNEALQRAGAHPVIRALGRAAAPPFVIYLSDGGVSVSLRAALVRLGPSMVAARGVDDRPERLRAIVDRAVTSRASDDLVTLLVERLHCLRASLVDALVEAIRSPLECDSVTSLALVAGMSSRSLSRDLRSAGLAPAREWLAAGRVLRAHWEMRRHSSLRIYQLVAMMGYSSDEPLAHDVDIILQMTPSELRRLSSSQLVKTIGNRLAPTPRRYSLLGNGSPHVSADNAGFMQVG